MKKKWDKKTIKKHASKYKTKTDFLRGDYGAYQAALKMGIIDELFNNVYKKWSYEDIKENWSKN